MEHTLEKPVILIVEDDPVHARAFKRILGPSELEIKLATTAEEGEELFKQFRSVILVIAMDEEIIAGLSRSTVDLVHLIRASGWKGVIIPTSDNPAGQQKLIDAGANAEHRVEHKYEVPEKIREVIQLIRSPKSGAS